ncbi:50S ribosomal protein L22 [Fimbriimonas ginsengisoli]|uniref:Large ribosomal subunit protein uL22 n=1 Tax=Fimbriimonas ginsengisoli Gsoil 348 TaxID=661478 RepID=A0A068NUP0_FIMGI|nr:50S ribosomal protein L22 [Fimbriimonas ginsengisoli Gsoil 348]
MEVRATAKYVRVQPRKVRIIADEIRGKTALHAAGLLRYHPSKSAKALRKVLISAIGNAQENHQLPADGLRIATIFIDEGPRLKRLRARAMGRGNRIIKKTSHITVVVEEFDAEPAVKPHGTKAKPRPTFAAPKARRGAAAKAAPAPEPVTPNETTDTDVEEVAPTVAEATPVAASEAPEEGGSATPVAEETTSAPESAETDGAAASDDDKGAQ